MHRFLITWELGGGIGHVSRLRPVVAELVARGHSVAVLSQNLPLVRNVLAVPGVTLLPAPQLWPPEQEVRVPCTFADVLYSVGYGNCEGVTATVAQWRLAYAELHPDFILCDHSPTALLAARGLPFAVAPIGTGFTIPPAVTPLPSLRQAIADPSWAADVEAIVLSHMNAALEQNDAEPLANVAELYAACERRYLLTYAELDHYRCRDAAAPYWRPLGVTGGEAPLWPAAPGAKIFVYLKYQPEVPRLLELLASSDHSILCYIPGIPDIELTLAQRPNMHITRRPINLDAASGAADVAVLNGGHGAVAKFLLAGTPILVLPQSLEQQVTGERLAEMGVGRMQRASETEAAALAIRSLLEEQQYAEAAAQFAARHGGTSDADEVGRLVDDIEGCVR